MTAFVKGAVNRIADPSEALLPDVVAADSTFGLGLFGRVAAEPTGNVLIAPSNIATVLTMTCAGARGETAEQLAGALGVESLGDLVHEARNALDLKLSAPRHAFSSPRAGGSPGDPLDLKMANSMWRQAGFQLLDPFLETLARNYDAGMNTADFAEAAEEARVTINQWVADHTKPIIAELLPRGVLNGLTRLLLVSTVSFKGSWSRPFDSGATVDGPFTRADGSQVTVPMMQPNERHGERWVRLGYAHRAGWQAVWISYVGGAAMVVLLPDQADATLDAHAWRDIEQSRGAALVRLTMPKFAFRARSSLVGPLTTLGVRDLFDASRADLSGIDGQRDLHVSAVEHETQIDVDEHGTTASAVTAAAIEEVSKPRDVTISFDRPFTFVIQDAETRALLFLGRVADPTAH